MNKTDTLLTVRRALKEEAARKAANEKSPAADDADTDAKAAS
jgi:hypothetical protein